MNKDNCPLVKGRVYQCELLRRRDSDNAALTARNKELEERLKEREPVCKNCGHTAKEHHKPYNLATGEDRPIGEEEIVYMCMTEVFRGGGMRYCGCEAFKPDSEVKALAAKVKGLESNTKKDFNTICKMQGLKADAQKWRDYKAIRCDAGNHPTYETEDQEKIAGLEKKVAELREAKALYSLEEWRRLKADNKKWREHVEAGAILLRKEKAGKEKIESDMGNVSRLNELAEITIRQLRENNTNLRKSQAAIREGVEKLREEMDERGRIVWDYATLNQVLALPGLKGGKK